MPLVALRDTENLPLLTLVVHEPIFMLRIDRPWVGPEPPYSRADRYGREGAHDCDLVAWSRGRVAASIG